MGVKEGRAIKGYALGVKEGASALNPGFQKIGQSGQKSKGLGADKNYLDSVFKVDAVLANEEKLKHSFVGTLWEARMAESVQMMINMEGFQNITATLLGIDKILLSSIKDEGVKQAVEADTNWWHKLFSEIKPWSSIQKPRGRRIWVRIFGTPPHAWWWECFHRIIWRFGRLIMLDGQTERQERLDVARAQIAVIYWDFVDEVIEIKVNEELFVVRVVEERFGEIDLGVKRTVNEQNFFDGRIVKEEWEDGWSEGSSGEIQKGGYCPVEKNTLSDNISKGEVDKNDHFLVKETDEGNKVMVAEDRAEIEAGSEDFIDENRFLTLAEVEIEEVGETQPTLPGDEISAAHVVTEGEMRSTRVM
ncbi:hypothetical protein TSUD_56910 [Trifolium subterraneum]|uniref:Uncharacterized protein n=1 Tax=Trifolium subterraneum TaxID=3900 RepID=A0A2Z6N3C4_TRISU|nr:hypothetical protein TSUD_56910 [Trifolium subterraneum]